jgi:hypothetical protein
VTLKFRAGFDCGRVAWGRPDSPKLVLRVLLGLHRRGRGADHDVERRRLRGELLRRVHRDLDGGGSMLGELQLGDLLISAANCLPSC